MPSSCTRRAARCRTRYAALAGLTIVLVAGCCRSTPSETPVPSGPPRVAVVNEPLRYFAGRIGGEVVDVVFPVPADVDPARWMPDDAAVSVYQSSDLILLNGADYSKWTGRVSLPASKLIVTTAPFEDRLIAMETTVTHRHGPEGEHDQGETAFTTWLDPTLAVEQARVIADAMIERWPDHREGFENRFDTLAADLQTLDEPLGSVASRRREQPLIASNPIYQYLARRYGMNLRSVHWEPGAMPDGAEWRRFDALRAEHPARWMIWEGTPGPEIEAALAERGVRCVVFDPCGNTPKKGDYLDVMRENVAALQAALGTP